MESFDYDQGLFFLDSVKKLEKSTEAYQIYELDANNFSSSERLKSTNEVRAVMREYKLLLLRSIELAKSMYRSGSTIRKACLEYRASINSRTEKALQQPLFAVNKHLGEQANTLKRALEISQFEYHPDTTELEKKRKAKRKKGMAMVVAGTSAVGLGAMITLDLFTTGGLVTLSSIVSGAATGSAVAVAGGTVVVGEAGAAAVVGGAATAAGIGAKAVGRGNEKREDANEKLGLDTSALVEHSIKARVAADKIEGAAKLLLESCRLFQSFCRCWTKKIQNSTASSTIELEDINKFLTKLWNVYIPDVPHYIRS